ncbi:hypothetical protein PG999_008468 [Apiospora kogelbergensis]|uniref:Uncharacterized protein n=1 Tax=Apiospora kogelbergensis TaxID=1337665 RepID=A0AAW0QHR8_9PEZI
MDAQGPMTPQDNAKTPGSGKPKSNDSKEPWKITNPAKWRLLPHLRKEKTKEQLEDETWKRPFNEAAETISELQDENQVLERDLDETYNLLTKAEADNDELRNQVVNLLLVNQRLLNGQPGLLRRILSDQNYATACQYDETVRQLEGELDDLTKTNNENYHEAEEAAELAKTLGRDNDMLHDALEDTHDHPVQAEEENEGLRHVVIALLIQNRQLRNMQPGLFRRIRDE